MEERLFKKPIATPSAKRYVFDLDGTLCEAWYGQYGPDYFISDEDAMLRALYEDPYVNTKPISIVQNLLFDMRHLEREVELYVLSIINTGHEYLAKVDWLQKYYPMIPRENIICVRSDEGKLTVLDQMTCVRTQRRLIYVDDRMDMIYTVRDHFAKENEPPVIAIHSSVLVTKSVDEILRLPELREPVIGTKYRSKSKFSRSWLLDL